MLVVVTAGVVWLLESGFLQRRTAQVRADDAPFAIDFPARPYPVVVGEDCLRIEGRVRDRTLREVVIDGERVPVRGDRFSTLVGFSRREATIVIRAAGHSEQVPVRFDLGIEFEAIAATAGGEATLRGHVASLSCREVTVNGESVVVGTRGRFRCKIPRETSQIEVLGRVGALEQRVTGLLRGR